MADITSRTIGYICPHCRNSVIAARSTFQLTASASCEIPCPCGKSSLNIEYLLDRFRITWPAETGILSRALRKPSCHARHLLFPVRAPAWTAAM